MTTRRMVAVSLGLLLLVGGATLWMCTHYQQVDGRTSTAWLAYAQQSARTVAYHAEGHTVSAGKSVHFTLDQDQKGRYLLHLDALGSHRCTLGDDGQKVWYQTGHTAQAAAIGSDAVPPVRVANYLVGLNTIAGAPAVAIAVHGGQTDKLIRLDRHTGVVLAMTTWFRHRVISDMTIDTIDYHPTTVAACPALPAALHPIDTARMTALLGAPPLRPRFLPRSFVAAGAFEDTCPCCGSKMVVLRYSNGLNALTLFEMRGGHTGCCACGPGCHVATDKNALVETRSVRDYTVIAVGSLDARAMGRVLGSL